MARSAPGPSEAGCARIAFLFVGGVHHVLHTAPVAAELAAGGTVQVVAYVGSVGEQAMLVRVLRAYGDPPIVIHSLPVPRWMKLLARLNPDWAMLKLPRLFLSRHALARNDALVVSERTSTILRRWLASPPLLIHIPHGAGDRAKGFEARLRHFDLVIVAGEKDRHRMIADGVVEEGKIVVGGPCKLGAMSRMSGDAVPLFANGKPTILYNPHFDAAIGSWPIMGRSVIEHLAGSDAYNLVVAPHVRLFEHVPKTRRSTVKALAVPGKIRIDLGSPASSDMTYTGGADIYLGDVSSQVYEFISQPRPCIFLNAHRISWRDDPNYLFWHMGEVIDDVADLLPALARAPARFAAEYRAVQVVMARQTFGTDIAGAPARTAGIIAGFVDAASSQKRRIALASTDPIFEQARDAH